MLAVFNLAQVGTMAVVVLLTFFAGMGDAFGYFHSSRVWHEGRLAWPEVVKALAGFAVSIGCYWYAVRNLNHVGVFPPEVQTLGLLVVTMLGMAFVSRQFFQWHPLDQGVAVLMVCAMGWLMVRTGA